MSAGIGSGAAGGTASVDVVTVSHGRSYHTADSREPVDEDEIQSAFAFGTDVVPVQESQRRAMKILGNKSLRVIAFVPRANVPRHHYMSTVDMVVPDASSPASVRALSALARALHEEGCVALVRFIKRNDSRGVNPILGCLTPHLCPASARACALATGQSASAGALFAEELSFDCLFFNQLPCEDDFRDYRFRPFDTEESAAPSAEQDAAALALVDSMDLTRVPVSETDA